MQDVQSRQGLLITAPVADTGDPSDQAALPQAPDLLRKNLKLQTFGGKTSNRASAEA